MPLSTLRSRRLPGRPDGGSRGRLLGAVAAAAALAAVVVALLVVPPDAVQGQAQRLMYLHVPAAWTAYLAFAAVALSSLATLAGGHHRRWDPLGQAAAELGVAMTAVTLVEGSIWGHSAWGVWWAWDPRLVSTAALFLVYVGYLALRALPGDPVRVRRRAAVLGAIAIVQVPVVHFSVLWWRTLHQPPSILGPELSSPPMAGSMMATLFLAVFAFTLAGAWYVTRRVEQLLPAAPGEAGRTERDAGTEQPGADLADPAAAPVRTVSREPV
jgi:heme exporter protein C